MSQTTTTPHTNEHAVSHSDRPSATERIKHSSPSEVHCFRTSTGINTRHLVMVAVFVAISAVLSFVELPIMPGAPWLKYDPSGSISLLSGFCFGPFTGCVVAVLSWIPHLFTNPLGALMNMIAAIGMIIPSAYLYRKNPTMSMAVKGLVLGVVLSVTLSLLFNFIVTPLFVPTIAMADVAKMILPILLPFNLIKQACNCGILLVTYKKVSQLVRSRYTNKASASTDCHA